MTIKYSKILLLIMLLLSITSCKTSKLKTTDLVIINESGQQIIVKAELAITDVEMQKGFMFRKHIPDGTGMLFFFKTDILAHFWMKNTPSPLSIAYIDYSGKIKDILDMTPYSLANVNSTGYVRYALEVPQGWFEKEGIKVGDTVTNIPSIK